MAFTETFKSLPDQFLDLLGRTQQAFLTTASAAAASAKSFTPAVVPSVPFADRLPDPAAVTDEAFAFAERLLANQRDFASKLVEAYVPFKAATTPAGSAASATSAASAASAKRA